MTHHIKGEAAKKVVLTRTYAAPRERVFRAWLDPKDLGVWWGPKGFTNPRVEVDATPGGRFRIDMRGPDGVVYPNIGKFVEIASPSRLVMTSGAFEDKAGGFQLEDVTTVSLDEKDGQTKVTVDARVTKATPEMKEALDGMEQGWSETLDRLGAYLSGRRVD